MEVMMSIIREPFYGGVQYTDLDTDATSIAYYPTTETEYSAYKNELMHIECDQLGCWPMQPTTS